MNDIELNGKTFDQVVQILQSSNSEKATRLRLHNVAVRGDFIPEKVLGQGVIGKYAELKPKRHPRVEGLVYSRASSNSTDSWDDTQFKDAVSSPTAGMSFDQFQ